MNESTSRAKAGKWAHSASPYCDVAVLEQFEPTIRSTDVFLSTFPKCGTTWVQNILYQLREGGDPNLDCIYNHVPWLEYPVDGFSTEERLKDYADSFDDHRYGTLEAQLRAVQRDGLRGALARRIDPAAAS
jgi:hypothetical protein